MTNDLSTGSVPRRVLPVVMDMCNLVNGVFVRYVGPIAHEIADEIYEHWRSKGDNGPSGVGHYIHLLSQHIVDEGQQSSFREEAATAMRQALHRRR